MRYCFWSILSCAVLAHSIAIAQENVQLDKLVVTATREAKSQKEVPESVSVIEKKEIQFIAPNHPSELLNRTAGVHVNNLGGEGHMTAIRQPITTGGVYLFLEDGLPTRPTGLFNHNALYEINIPQAERVEIIKGPGSALYGSDSIGGIVNTITRAAPDQPEFEINPEYGSHGSKRLLTTAGAPINDNIGIRWDLNLTDNDGYRDQADYKRYATTGRIDGFVGDDTSFKTIISYNQIQQSGVSGLEVDDYHNDTRKNLYHGSVGRRDVRAWRLSTELAYEPDNRNLYTITPFFRHNEMDLMPSWMLTFDPNDRQYRFQSYGFLAKYRHKAPESGIEIVTGVDVDYTPSSYREIRLATTMNGDIFTGAAPTGRVNYDFSADQLSISPYLHTEWQALKDLRLTAGLRYDYFQVDYQDNLPASVPQRQFGFGGFNHQRPGSQDLSYDSFSPKLGLVYNLTSAHDAYANYRHSFRVPSIGQLFRPGSTTNTASLNPVQTDSFEVGIRGQFWDRFQYDLALYHMIVNDDIVRYIDNVSNSRQTANAGKTTHQGIEISVQGDLTEELSLSTAWSFSQQEYDDFTAIFGFPPTQINYAGNQVGKAPDILGNVAVQYRPNFLPGSMVEAEWVHVGGYYTDETNTQNYGGHGLFNLRGSYDITDTVQLYGRVMNVTDQLYSVYTSNQVGDPDIQYRPGLPRSFYAGLRAKF